VSRAPIPPGQLPEELRKREAALKAAIARGIRNGVRRNRAMLVMRTPKDNGLLKASWHDSASRGGRQEGVVAEVWNDAPYAGIVEEGARPHGVSAAGRLALYEWAHRHFPAAEDAELKGIVWAICKKLRERGQEGTFFVRNARVALASAMIDEIRAATAKLAQQPRVGA
jgi:hypothetical protein